MNPIIEMLCVDQHDKSWSNTKFWANLGYLILIIAFAHQVWDSTASTELYLVFGGLLLGNRTLNMYLKSKGSPNVSSVNSKEDQ